MAKKYKTREQVIEREANYFARCILIAEHLLNREVERTKKRNKTNQCLVTKKMNDSHCKTCVYIAHKEIIEIRRICIPFCRKHNKELKHIQSCNEYKQDCEF